MRIKRTSILFVSLLAQHFMSPQLTFAQIAADKFTGTSASLLWSPFQGACLTAGNNTGTIPACQGLAYYGAGPQQGGATGTLPDTPGNGALRLTGNAFNQAGSILSTKPFSANKGLQITFSTVTYRGDSGGAAANGADGISFFLVDASRPFSDIGSYGGSLGYSCSNSNAPYGGITGGYIGLGIDEYGNFLNEGDNSSTGFGYVPQRIGLRGAGNISWNWLNKNYPIYYPSAFTAAQQQAAVQNTCRSGFVWDSSAGLATNTAVPDYQIIPNGFQVLPAGRLIANEAAQTRLDATPISYKLKISQSGLLSLDYSYNGGTYEPILSNQSISAANGPLPSNVLFGFAGSTGGSYNIHEITCFQAAPADTASTSASVNVRESGEVKTGTQVYLAFFHSDNWWGQLTSKNLLYDSVTQTVSIAPSANWDASCVLTGGACAATNAITPVESPAARAILTWNPVTAAGIPFQWTNLTANQQAALNAGDLAGQLRLNYLRGDRSQEIASAGPFRTRTSVLGDLINSSPSWVGPASAPYSGLFVDKFAVGAPTPPENTGQTYSQFIKATATRTNVVYSGANDGLMHGYRSGNYDGTGTGGVGDYGNYVSTGNDGLEVLAYMPDTVLENSIHNNVDASMDYSSPQYAHNYFVDATPASGDLFYQNAWHTWLVGGLGTGGKGIFALDITDPTKFSESNANSLVIGEWNSSNLICVTTNCVQSLGKTQGTPAVRRLHNGQWAIIFGNGLNSTTGRAGIFVITIDSTTGKSSTIRFLDTGAGSTTSPNGINFVTPVDLDGDHITDFVYAGDLLGNIWRFDLTGANPTTWGTSPSTPLFTTPTGQPITTQVLVAAVPAPGAARVVVEFGTGQVVQQTRFAPALYSSGTQSLYGVWDVNFLTWNAGSTTKYSALPSASTITASQLQPQSVTATFSPTSTGAGVSIREISKNQICWKGSSTLCDKFGFKLDLPSANEQVIFSPILTQGSFIVNTIIPPQNSPLTCAPDTPTGFTMAIDPATGGAFTTSFFANTANNYINYLGKAASGLGLSASGSPSVVIANRKPFLINQTNTGAGTVNEISPPGNYKGSRLTWIELR